MANESTGNCVPVERPKKDMPPPPPPSSADSLLCERPLQISIAMDVFFSFLSENPFSGYLAGSRHNLLENESKKRKFNSSVIFFSLFDLSLGI